MDVKGAAGDSPALERAGEDVVAVVHEPDVPTGDNGVPCVGLLGVRGGPVAVAPGEVALQRAGSAQVSKDGVVTRPVDKLAVIRPVQGYPRDCGFGHLYFWADRCQRLGVQDGEERVIGAVADEVLHDQVAIGEGEQAVVRLGLRQLPARDESAASVHAVAVTPICDVQVAVLVRHDPAGPERATGQVG